MGVSLLERLEQWHQSDQYDEVVKALTALTPQEMNDNLYGQLARALNNLGRYEEALKALEPVSEAGRDDIWWYRRGYALYYLERYEEAKQALNTVIQMNPDDSEAEEFVQDCEDMMLRQRGKEPFRSRVKRFWNQFLHREEELRALMDEKKMVEAMELAASLLDVCFSEHWMELGKSGETYELTLSAEGQKHRLLLLYYWRDHAPQELSDRWLFHVGRRRAKTLHQWSIRIYEQDIAAKDVFVWTEQSERNRLFLSLFSPVLAELLNGGSDGENKAYAIAEILLDQALGETTAMNVIDGLELLPQKKETKGMELTALFDFVKEHCSDWDADPCDSYGAYRCTPKLKDAQLREDIFVGSSRCNRLIGEFYNGESDIFREGMENGAVFGYLFFNNDEIDRNRMVSFRGEMEEELEEKTGDSCLVIGGATGINYSYIDVLCYDYPQFLQGAKEMLNSRKQLREMGFCEFIYNGFEEDLRNDRPECYSEEQEETVLAHIEEHFGPIDEILGEGDIKTVVVRSEERACTILCTAGMGARRMNVPRNLRPRGVDRVELFMVLPKDWDVQSAAEEERWPADWLRFLSELPFRDDSWLGFGQTVSNGKPFASNTELAGSLVVSATEFGSEAGECTLSDGTCVIFYGIAALYKEEMEYARENGAEALLDLMKEENVTATLDIARQNLCQW